MRSLPFSGAAFHLRIIRCALGTTVPAVSVIVPVRIIPAIFLIVLSIISIKVVQCEPIVTGDKINRSAVAAVYRIIQILDPVIRVIAVPAIPPSPFKKRRMSSRYLPFHSAQRLQDGKLPTWYSPPASHASAISFAFPRIGSHARLCKIGGLFIGAPFSSLLKIEARSNRKPSTRYSVTQ